MGKPGLTRFEISAARIRGTFTSWLQATPGLRSWPCAGNGAVVAADEGARAVEDGLDVHREGDRRRALWGARRLRRRAAPRPPRCRGIRSAARPPQDGDRQRAGPSHGRSFMGPKPLAHGAAMAR